MSVSVRMRARVCPCSCIGGWVYVCVCICVYVRMRECQWARINPNVFAVSLQILQVMICNNNVPSLTI